MKTKTVPMLVAVLFGAGALTVAAQQWTTNNLPAGLLAWWQAEGNYLDTVEGNDLTPEGGVSFASGRFGQAFRFNGTDGSAYRTNAPTLNGWTQFTLEAWINLDATNDAPTPGAGRGIISRVGTPANHNLNFGYQFGLYDDSRRMFCQFNTNGQGWPGFQTTTPLSAPLVTGVWYHLAATYDHSAVKLYFNGAPLTTNVIGPATIITSPSSFRLSKDDNANVPFSGRIDDARIYNRALTGGEIAYVYSGRPPLTIVPAAANTVIVSWPLAASDWILERTNVIGGAAASWPQVPPPYQTNGADIHTMFTNAPPTGNQFFRLHKL